MRAYGVFEGGGALGIAHLGAYEATRTLGIEFLGVGGASAGAFVAAMIAAGYPPETLLTPTGARGNLLADYGLQPVDLLGADEWADWLEAESWVRSGSANRVAIFGLVGSFTWPRAFRRVVQRIRETGGIFSTAGVRDFVNRALRDRLLDLAAEIGVAAEDVPQDVTFDDLDPRRFVGADRVSYAPVPLRIVASDIDTGAAVLFGTDGLVGSDSNGHVPIADAVAASIAIPLFFQPKRIPTYLDGQHRFADGGLVANLPIWIHDDEKLLYARANPDKATPPTLAFSLIGAQVPGDTADVLNLLGRIVRTGVFGGQSLINKMATEVVRVDLDCSKTGLSTTSFNAPWPKIREAHAAGRRDAMRTLGDRCFASPSVWEGELEGIRLEALRLVQEGQGAPLANDTVRANVLFPYRDHSLRVTYGAGMRLDADDRLLVDLRTRGAALAFRRNQVTVVQLTSSDGQPSYMTKYELALLRPMLNTIVSAPIPAPADRPAGVTGVLSVDMTFDCAQIVGSVGFTRWIVEQARVLSSISWKEIGGE
jgi:predicted acylesterase/phospholipase RssA